MQHRSSSCLLPPADTPKRCPQEGERHKVLSSSDPADPDLGFPLEHREREDADCYDDASNKVTTPRRRHRPPKARLSPAAAPSNSPPLPDVGPKVQHIQPGRHPPAKEGAATTIPRAGTLGLLMPQVWPGSPRTADEVDVDIGVRRTRQAGPTPTTAAAPPLRRLLADLTGRRQLQHLPSM
jgi:hypothetical protein